MPENMATPGQSGPLLQVLQFCVSHGEKGLVSPRPHSDVWQESVRAVQLEQVDITVSLFVGLWFLVAFLCRGF